MADDQTHTRETEQDHDIANLIESRFSALSRLVFRPRLASLLFVALFQERVEELGQEEAGTDGVDSDALTAGFESGLEEIIVVAVS